jgi:hypothetical protein
MKTIKQRYDRIAITFDVEELALPRFRLSSFELFVLFALLIDRSWQLI